MNRLIWLAVILASALPAEVPRSSHAESPGNRQLAEVEPLDQHPNGYAVEMFADGSAEEYDRTEEFRFSTNTRF